MFSSSVPRIAIALFVLGASGAAAEDVKSRTTRVVDPAVRLAFYRSGGRHLLGRKIHLHVESAVLLRDPRVVPSKHDGDFLVFENRTVPIVVETRNRYWKQVARHLEDAAEFCLRGTLHVPETDPHRRAHLFVKSIKRAPGTWRTGRGG
jgi:hypothetical protein